MPDMGSGKVSLDMHSRGTLLPKADLRCPGHHLVKLVLLDWMLCQLDHD